jgi:type IV fimbrial biogenesis protein FimT
MKVSVASSLSKGFTLIELMVVVSIVAILGTLAAPSFNALATSQALRSASSELHISLMQARSEALRTNRNVYVVPVSATDPATTADWAAGWTVFVDNNNSGATYEAGTDTIVSKSAAISPKLVITAAKSNAISFTFDARGFNGGSGVTNAKVTFASADDGSKRKMVIVDRLGKARVCDYLTNAGCEP